jgi:hypothetical protein
MHTQASFYLRGEGFAEGYSRGDSFAVKGKRSFTKSDDAHAVMYPVSIIHTYKYTYAYTCVYKST